MATVVVDDSCPQADSWPKLGGLVALLTWALQEGCAHAAQPVPKVNHSGLYDKYTLPIVRFDPEPSALQ